MAGAAKIFPLAWGPRLMPTIIYLPGVMGSNLACDLGGWRGRRRLWVSLEAAATGSLSLLQLASDGISPGPLAQGTQVVVDGQVSPVYAPLGRFMQLLGWRVLSLSYDWRRGVVPLGTALATYIRTQFRGEPFHLVAHSMGGLISRLAMRELDRTGQLDLVRRLITLGTPHYGSWSSVRLFAHLDPTYLAITGLGIANYPMEAEKGLKYLDAVLASFPGIYDLLPSRHYGPLASASMNIANAVYDSRTYRGYNTSVMQNRLDDAVVTQQVLEQSIYPTKQVSIIGVGQKTANIANLNYPLYLPSGYYYTQDGDGTVSLEYASIPGIAQVLVDASHAWLPLNQTAWSYIRQHLI